MAEEKQKQNKKHDQKTRALIADFSSSLVFFVIAIVVILIIALTLSWFAMNRLVNGNSGNVTVENEIFELGTVTLNDARAVDVDSAALDVLSSDVTRTYDRDALETDDSTEAIICALTTDDGKPARPGSTGTLEFRILPKVDNNDFTVQATISGLKKIVDEIEGTVSYELMDPTDADEGLALDLLAGHVLFFTGSTFSSSNMIDIEDGFVVTGAHEANTEYLVTLYWEWPRVYSEHESYVDAAWQSTHEYLYDGTNEDGYNNADQVIGEAVAYIVAEMDVSPGATSGLTTVTAAEIP
ncbi:MAG: hypothetical protein IJT18_00895 [Oscillospiraceae bacterium]|nr:hypothetical protein [Oscillospiraceae bacterium]